MARVAARRHSSLARRMAARSGKLGTPACTARSNAKRARRRCLAIRWQTKRPPNWQVFSGDYRKTSRAVLPPKFWSKSFPPMATGRAKRKTVLRKPLEKFFADAAFLHSLAPVERRPRSAGGRLGLGSRPHERVAAADAGISPPGSPRANATTAFWIFTIWNSSR